VLTTDLYYFMLYDITLWDGKHKQKCLRPISSAKRPGPSHEVKLRRHEADCSPHVTTKVKNNWSYTSATSYAFMRWTGTTLLFFASSIIVVIIHN